MPKKLVQHEVEKTVLRKCKEKNIVLVKNFIYNGAYTIISLRCKKDGYEWNSTYNSFINQNKGCLKCSGKIKLTQQEAEERILKKCIERNYELIEPFVYKDNTTKLHLKCNIDNYEWKSKYQSFINQNKGCLKCSGKIKLTQQEAEERILKKCEDKNYTLVENFIYKNSDSRIYLKCNKDNYKWSVSYDNYINNNTGCPKCGNAVKLTQEDVEKKILNKCKEKNYMLVEKFIYINNETKIHLKCNFDNHEWYPTYVNFINKSSGCPKCNGNLKCIQQEAEENILNKCKERNYELVEGFIYKNNRTKIHLKCNICSHKWFTTYYNLLIGNKGCSKCNESKGENKISKILKEKNIKFEPQKKFEDCKN